MNEIFELIANGIVADVEDERRKREAIARQNRLNTINRLSSLLSCKRDQIEAIVGDSLVVYIPVTDVDKDDPSRRIVRNFRITESNSAYGVGVSIPRPCGHFDYQEAQDAQRLRNILSEPIEQKCRGCIHNEIVEETKLSNIIRRMFGGHKKTD